MNNEELEDYLSKALNGLQSYKEPNRKFQDKLSNQLKQENIKQVKAVFKDMLDEIESVIKPQ